MFPLPPWPMGRRRAGTAGTASGGSAACRPLGRGTWGAREAAGRTAGWGGRSAHRPAGVLRAAPDATGRGSLMRGRWAGAQALHAYATAAGATPADEPAQELLVDSFDAEQVRRRRAAAPACGGVAAHMCTHSRRARLPSCRRHSARDRVRQSAGGARAGPQGRAADTVRLIGPCPTWALSAACSAGRQGTAGPAGGASRAAGVAAAGGRGAGDAAARAPAAQARRRRAAAAGRRHRGRARRCGARAAGLRTAAAQPCIGLTSVTRAY